MLIVVVVSRFLVRELRARTVRLDRMWIRPAVLLALTALAVFGAYAVHGGPSLVLYPALLCGLILGAVVGFFVAGSTAIESSGRSGYARLRGSWTTVAIWLGALAVRMLARFVLGSGGVVMQTSAANIAQTTAVNAGTILLVAVAFGVFAVLIVRRAAALGTV